MIIKRSIYVNKFYLLIVALIILAIFDIGNFFKIKCVHDNFVRNAKIIPALVTDREYPSRNYRTIYYQFKNNGSLINQSERIRCALLWGSCNLSQGDKIKVYFYDGRSMIYGYYEEIIESTVVRFLFFIFLIILCFLKGSKLQKRISDKKP